MPPRLTRRANLFPLLAILVLLNPARSTVALGAKANPSADTRLPIPSEEAQAAARATFQQYFVRHYGHLNVTTGREFAQYLVRTYAHDGDHPVARYVALSLAWRLFAHDGFWGEPRMAIRLLAKFYAVDRWTLYLKSLHPLFHTTIYIKEDRNGVRQLGKLAAHWARDATAAGDYGPVPGLLRWAVRYDRQAHNQAAAAAAASLAEQFRLLAPTQTVYHSDLKIIKADPNNADALMRMALYYWLVSTKPDARVNGNAEAKKSGYASLAKIMKLTAQGPKDAHGLIRLGNLWWNLAKTHKLLAYTPLVKQHAVKIYRQAIPAVAQAFSAMIGNGDYHAAVLFIGQAKKAAARTRDPKILAIAHQWNRMLRQARVLHRRYTAALKTISKKANDPAANQTIGEYLCFLGGQWKSGLAYLKLAGLPGLREAAKMDLANPQTPAAQIALGNKWWILARGYRGIMKTNIQVRAAYWYAMALKKLPAGADKDLRYRVVKLQDW